MCNSFTCPYCQNMFALHLQTHKKLYVNFDGQLCDEKDSSSVCVEYFHCPNCDKMTVTAMGLGPYTEFPVTNLRPTSLARKFPDYVPESIRTDYKEAYDILTLSPKASATLSRRCIQGMIRSIWNVKHGTLYNEISNIKGKIDPTLWKAIDSLRQLGNIGAHMENEINTIVDIDSGEAEKLIKLVELLIKEWYIIPYERNVLLSDIIQINSEKQEQRRKTE